MNRGYKCTENSFYKQLISSSEMPLVEALR